MMDIILLQIVGDIVIAVGIAYGMHLFKDTLEYDYTQDIFDEILDSAIEENDE